MPWTPADLPSLAAWYDAADAGTITLNGSTVSEWRDKSGNARHVSQATAANQPAYTPGAITFDGTNDHLTAANVNFSSTDKMTVVMALRNVAADVTRSAFMFGAPFGNVSGLGGDFPADSQRRIRIDVRGSVTAFPSSAISVATQNVTSVFGFGADIAGDSIFAFVDGAQVLNNTSDLGTGSFGTSNLFIGSYNASGAFFSGTIYETVVVPALLSVADRQKIEGYLAWKWGTVNRLPGNHPYRYDGALFGYANLWNPSNLPSLVTWYDPTDPSTIILNGSTVSQLNDKSASGYHLSQPTASLQPSLTTANGLTALEFNQNWLERDTASISGTQLMAFWVGNRKTSSFANARAISWRSNDTPNDYDNIQSVIPLLTLSGDPRPSFYRASGGVTASASIPTTGLVLVSSGTDGATRYIGVDGTLTPSTGPQTGAISAEILRVGDSAMSLQEFWNGTYAEIIVASAYNFDDKQKIEGYLAWKWGIQANLPAGHPYKSAAPQTGAAGITGVASGAFGISGASTGTVVAPPARTGVAAGSISLDGTATGGVSVSGSASGSFGLTGTSAGTVAALPARTGVAAGSISLSGTSTGTVTAPSALTGVATGTISLDGSAAGGVRVAGVASGSLGLTGASAGAVAPAGSVNGQAAGTLPLTGASTGAVAVSGVASGVLPITGASTGTVALLGTAAGTFPLSGGATGTVVTLGPITGTAAGELPFFGQATGTSGTPQLRIIYGDDAFVDHESELEKFWRKKREEMLEEFLEEAPKPKPRKARQKAVREFLAVAPRIAEDKALAPRVEAAKRIAEAVAKGPDYAAIARMAAEEQDRVAKIKARRRRDLETILMMVA